MHPTQEDVLDAWSRYRVWLAEAAQLRARFRELHIPVSGGLEGAIHAGPAPWVTEDDKPRRLIAPCSKCNAKEAEFWGLCPTCSGLVSETATNEGAKR